MRTKLFALSATVALLLVPLGPGIGAAVAADTGNAPLDAVVSQTEDGAVTVAVTANESALENASVTVDAPNATYAGAGTYTTDENGTVGLPAPGETVTIEATADAGNRTATTTATLTAIDEQLENSTGPFGQTMASLVGSLFGTSSGPLGPLIAGFAVSNNPGNAPANAGPPAFLFGDDDGDDRGPPEDAGPSEDAEDEDEEEEEREDEEEEEREDEGDDDGGNRNSNGNSNGNGNGNDPPN